MNKTFLVHGAWLVIAISSFVVGVLLFPAGNDSGRWDANGKNLVSSTQDRGRLSSGGSKGSGSQTVINSGSSITSLSDHDIEELGERFRSAASPINRRLAFSKLLEGLTPENALRVREQIAHLHHHSAEFREFHYAWGALAGAEAAMFGASTEEDDMSPALAGWAGADPASALNWFTGLDMENDSGFDPLLKDRKVAAGELRMHLMRGLVDGLAANDPRTATDFVHAMVKDGQRGAEQLMHAVTQAVMRADGPAGAAEWAETLPEGSPRAVAMHRLANGYANQDPKAAAAWVEGIGDRPYSAGVTAEVGVSWSRKDPQAALDWMTNLPDGQGKNASLHRTLNEWAGREPTAASKFLVDMPASDAKDSAISGFTGRLAWEDPQAALEWVGEISSEEHRLEATVNAGRAWARKDANAAAEWAVSSGLPENIQQAIFSPPEDRKDRRD